MDWSKFLGNFARPLFYLGEIPVTVVSMVQFIVLLMLVILAARTVRRMLRARLLVRLPIGRRDAIARLVGYVVLALGFMVAMQTLGVDLTALTVFAGALSIGIGFGLQNIANNFLSGLIILVERPIQLGDRVEIGGVQGDVVRIGGRSTTIRSNDNIDMIIPNGEFISEQVVNLSHGDQKVRIRVPFGVSFGSDPRKVEKIALEVAAADEHVLNIPQASVRFMGFGDNSMKFELRTWTAKMAHQPDLFRSNLYFALWDGLKKAGIEIPFSQRDINFRNPIRIKSRV